MPLLTRAHAREAEAVLRGGADVTFGPALDGGYWMVGLSRPSPDLFDLGGDWGGPAVLARSLERARGGRPADRAAGHGARPRRPRRRPRARRPPAPAAGGGRGARLRAVGDRAHLRRGGGAAGAVRPPRLARRATGRCWWPTAARATARARSPASGARSVVAEGEHRAGQLNAAAARAAATCWCSCTPTRGCRRTRSRRWRGDARRGRQLRAALRRRRPLRPRPHPRLRVPAPLRLLLRRLHDLAAARPRSRRSAATATCRSWTTTTWCGGWRSASTPPACRAPRTTSPRRWRAMGIPRTLVTWWVIRLLFVAGVPAERLAGLYGRAQRSDWDRLAALVPPAAAVGARGARGRRSTWRRSRAARLLVDLGTGTGALLRRGGRRDAAAADGDRLRPSRGDARAGAARCPPTWRGEGGGREAPAARRRRRPTS